MFSHISCTAIYNIHYEKVKTCIKTSSQYKAANKISLSPTTLCHQQPQNKTHPMQFKSNKTIQVSHTSTDNIKLTQAMKYKTNRSQTYKTSSSLIQQRLMQYCDAEQNKETFYITHTHTKWTTQSVFSLNTTGKLEF